MWTEFLIAAIVGLIAIYLPGMLIARASRRSIVDCFVYAPTISIAIYSCMGIVYAWAGIACNWATTFLVLLVIGIVCWMANLVVLKRARKALRPAPISERLANFIKYNSDWKFLAAYIICWLCVTGFMFLKSLNGADGFSSELDNSFHYGTIRTFAETGNWSSLGNGGFYPSAWHVLGALIYGIFPTEVTLVSNVENTLFIAFVFSSGMFAWLRRIFPNNNTAILFGIFCSFLIDALPWNHLVYGPTISFMAAICLLPAAMAAFMDLTEYGTSRSCKARLAVIFALALIVLALMQTSVVFALMLFALPYCWSRVMHSPALDGTDSPKRKKALIIVGLTALWLIIWIGCYLAPFMQDIINFEWYGAETLPGAIAQVLTFDFFQHDMYLFMAVLSWVGLIACFATKKRCWLPVPFLYMAVAYVACSADNGFLDKLITGFWYTDPIRIITMCALFAVPLMCFTLTMIEGSLMAFIKRRSSALEKNRVLSAASGALVSFVLVCLMVPTVSIDPEIGISFGHTMGRGGIVWEYNSNDDHQYSRDKSAFMREAAKIIDGERVLNNPTDGSIFSWGIDGVDVVYKNFGERTPSSSNEAIASHISGIAADTEVQAAVKATGARYLLQLDTPEDIDAISNRPNSDFIQYWSDFYSVNENTPGLELVLQDGDKKLYRILPFE